MAKQPTMQQLTITQTRSVIGANQRQKRTMQALGLTKINCTVQQPDNPAIRGMVRKVAHLVTILTPQSS